MQSNWYRFFAAALALVVVTAAAPPASAQTGKTLTPDLLTYLVSDVIFGDRWTIGLNVAPGDESTIVNLTGNILRGSGDATFVHCLPRVGSTQFTRQPGVLLTFDCKLMGACENDAMGCSRFDWQILTGPGGFAPTESFFLPGNGASAGSADADHATLARTMTTWLASQVYPPPVPPLAPGRRAEPEPAVAASADEPESAQGGGGLSRTLTEDGFNHLVTFDLFGARWSVSLNLFPMIADSGALVKVLSSMTGNLFFSDGRAPIFVHCVVRDDSNGHLDDQNSIFRFDCDSAVSCQGDPVACAQTTWSTLAVDVRLTASTFLPPDGLGLPPGSDPGLIVLPPADGPASFPGVAVSTSQGNSVASRSLAGASGSGGCNVGSSCSMSIGSCGRVNGTIDDLPQACACSVRRVPENCIECGGNSAGSPCNFRVAGAVTARGICLPTSYLGNSNACFAIEFEGEAGVRECGGPVHADCPRGACCADDPRDGCVPSATNGNCAGVCVALLDCDPSRRSCGICGPFQSVGGSQSEFSR